MLVDFQPDAREGALMNLALTLSATPGDVTAITLPAWARGFRLYPAELIRFAVGEDPASASSTAADVTIDDFGVGGVAQPDQWEPRLLDPGASRARTLRISSPTASVVVYVELF